MSESFFVISGTVQLYDGKQWIDATAGDFVYVPEGGVHGFRNGSDDPASMLILFAPGSPREPYFEAIAARAAGRHFSDEEWEELCRRHDNRSSERPVAGRQGGGTWLTRRARPASRDRA
jgi:oxalate decarboxylase/phosphoglucose isomerase-like protein (cupin superfamily)